MDVLPVQTHIDMRHQTGPLALLNNLLSLQTNYRITPQGHRAAKMLIASFSFRNF